MDIGDAEIIEAICLAGVPQHLVSDSGKGDELLIRAPGLRVWLEEACADDSDSQGGVRWTYEARCGAEGYIYDDADCRYVAALAFEAWRDDER